MIIDIQTGIWEEKTLDLQLLEVSDAATLPPDGLRRALSSVYNAQRFKVGLLVKTPGCFPGVESKPKDRDFYDALKW